MSNATLNTLTSVATLTPSVCFPRLPFETKAKQIEQLFEEVDHVDMVWMEDSEGDYQMAFVHFREPEKMRKFVEHIDKYEFYMNDWLVKPNYKPIKRSTRKWTEVELEEIEQFFREKEGK